MNEWLKKRAIKNQNTFSITRVACVEHEVIAYYTLTYSGINRSEMSRKIQINSPDKIPVMVLGRLAVDRSWQGKDIAKHLLKEALLKTLEASRIAAIRGVLVHAIDDQAVSFYKHYGFLKTKIELTLLLPLEDIKNQL